MLVNFCLLIAYYFYQNNQNEEFVRWGDSIHTVDTEKLKENDIEYKIENGKVYIPKVLLEKQHFAVPNNNTELSYISNTQKDVDYSTSLFYFIRFLVLYLLYQIS